MSYLLSQVLSPWFAVFSTVYLSALGQQLQEVLSDGGTILTWWNEQRIWVIKSVSGCLFGCLDLFMKWLGVKKTTFRLTNKAVDKEKLEKYEKGEFDFQGATTFMVPLSVLVILNNEHGMLHSFKETQHSFKYFFLIIKNNK